MKPYTQYELYTVVKNGKSSGTKMDKETAPILWFSIIRRLQKAKKMDMFPSGLPDLASRALFLMTASIFNWFWQKLHPKILGTNHKDWQGWIWPNWPLKGPYLARSYQKWPEMVKLNFRAEELKFASEINFHASRKATGLDWTKLASKGLDVARTGQYWPELVKPQFSS